MKPRIWAVLLSCSVILTGCWDKLELDKRTFVLGAAVDVPEKDAAGTGPEIYMLTMESPKTKEIGGRSGASGGRSGEAKAALLQTGTGKSFFDIIRRKAAESDRTLFFGHQQVLIIGEKLAMQRNLNEVMDFWERSHEVDRSLKVFLARGSARDIFNADTRNSETVSIFIMNHSEQYGESSRLKDMDLVAFSGKLAGGGNFLAGGISLTSGKGLNLSESAIIKNGRLVGWLDGEEANAAQIIMNEGRGNELSIPNPEDGGVVSVEVAGVNTDIDIKMQEGMPHFAVSVRMQCNIAEINGDISEIDEKGIVAINRAISKNVEGKLAAVLKKLQKQYNADVFGFGEKLRKYRNKEWKKLEGSWDGLYTEVPISVRVDARIRRAGRTF